MTIYKKKGTLLTLDDEIELAMGATIVLVDDWEKAFELAMFDFSEAINSDDDILVQGENYVCRNLVKFNRCNFVTLHFVTFNRLVLCL